LGSTNALICWRDIIGVETVFTGLLSQRFHLLKFVYRADVTTTTTQLPPPANVTNHTVPVVIGQYYQYLIHFILS
jgi:hypothetical protein